MKTVNLRPTRVKFHDSGGNRYNGDEGTIDGYMLNSNGYSCAVVLWDDGTITLSKLSNLRIIK